MVKEFKKVNQPIYISTKKAKEIAENKNIFISKPTIIRYVKKNNMGVQLEKRSKWYINKQQWEDFLSGMGAWHLRTTSPKRDF